MTSEITDFPPSALPGSAPAGDEPATVDEQAAAPVAIDRELAIPNGTLPLLAILLGAGALVLLFAFVTVHRFNSAELAADSMARRAHFETSYWLEHGYFQSAGLRVRAAGPENVFFYRSSTGGVLLGGFVVEKLYSSVTGRYSWRLLALYNQLFSLLASALLGFLGFRLARRIGASPLHALTLAIALEAVHFTFPDNLMTYWELSSRIPWLFFACVFLLIEERGVERRTRAWTIAQAAAAFFMTYMELTAGAAFLASYAILSLLAGAHTTVRKQLLLVCLLPLLSAYGFYAVQLTAATTWRPEIPIEGSSFLFRTGLDGSSQYYGDHLDIALRRDAVREVFPANRPYLFRWPWLFLTGVIALAGVCIVSARGRAPAIAATSILSLLGAYLLYAALFSQAVFIHPYYYDVMLFTPLALALFVVAPSLLESATARKGMVVAAVFFLAIWISMMQVRRYALQYPRADYEQNGW